MFSLGIEFSTQSVKLLVLDIKNSKAAYTGSFDYDKIFPEYRTEGGVLVTGEPEIRHTSPFMLIESLDFAFKRLKEDGVDLSPVRIVKTDCMQHCTVYTDKSFKERIQALNPGEGLLKQLKPSISRNTSPIWEDRSPVMEADLLTDRLQDKGGIETLTGNRVELRFPALQILKWAKVSPEEYNNTSNIFLLSAFITSILAGRIVPVDTGDGWGTNYNNLDINNPGWSRDVLSVINSCLKDRGLDTPLENKIGKIDHYDTELSRINPYFADKFGINPDAIVLAGTGDNPATLLGCGGQIVISLGSSYTVNGVMKEIAPSETGEYNVFGYTRGRAMALSVFTNGGKVHEHLLRKYILKSENKKLSKLAWDAYSAAAGEPILCRNENIMLPYLMEESVPYKKRGIVRDGFCEDDINENIRALHVSQALSIRLHSGHLSNVDELFCVGGGADNKLLMQLIADAFDARVYTIRNAGFAAPFGCSVSGAKVLMGISYQEAAERFVQRDESVFIEPIKDNVAKIDTLLERYKLLENRVE